MPAVLLSPKPATAQFNLGCIIIGTYINILLYAVVMFSVFLYFRSQRSKRDRLFVKLAVGACAVMDTVGTFGVCNSTFYLFVIRYGNFDSEFRTHWSPVMAFIASAGSEFVVQAFMVRIYFVLSRGYLLSAFMVALMLVSLESNLYLAIASAARKLPSDERPSNLTPFIIALATSLACDMATTSAMFWTLKKTKTSTRITHNIVSRISAIVISTGTLMCILVVATGITFLAYPMSSLTSSFNCFLGRAYTATMLFTLLYRDIRHDECIQVDDMKEDSNTLVGSSVHSSTHECTRPATISVPEMIFARRESFTPPKFPSAVYKISLEP